jgi:hypothetical protein
MPPIRIGRSWIFLLMVAAGAALIPLLTFSFRGHPLPSPGGSPTHLGGNDNPPSACSWSNGDGLPAFENLAKANLLEEEIPVTDFRTQTSGETCGGQYGPQTLIIDLTISLAEIKDPSSLPDYSKNVQELLAATLTEYYSQASLYPLLSADTVQLHFLDLKDGKKYWCTISPPRGFPDPDKPSGLETHCG